MSSLVCPWGQSVNVSTSASVCEGGHTFYEYFNLNDNLLSGIFVVVVAAIVTRITTTMVVV